MRIACINVWGRLICIAAIIVLLVYTFKTKKQPEFYVLSPKDIIAPPPLPVCVQSPPQPLWKETLDFNKLNWTNETGNPTGCYVVPNYIHFVRFGITPVDYVQLICILAAFKNQKPDKIFFHYDNKTTFTGKYWEILEQTPGFMETIIFHKVELPEKIFGQPLSPEWKIWHGSDIMRIRMVMKYGGIFLDNDCYLIKNIDYFRRFEISVNWDEGEYLASQVIIAHKDARFLKRWLNCYKVYDKTQWYYNAGERPTTEVLYKEPELIHRIKVLFGADMRFAQNLYQQQWKDWKALYVIHILARHQYLLRSLSKTAKFPVEFNENNIAFYPITFREMAYDVYDVANIKWPKNRFDN